MRAAALLAPLLLAGCVITSGPDCSDACSKVVECEGLDKTFLLACGTNSAFCGPDEAACAECIEQKSCAELVRGDCDFVAGTGGDGGVPLCLVTP
jgi:hypothetical protein